VLGIALSSSRKRRHSLQWSCCSPVPLFTTLIRPMISYSNRKTLLIGLNPLDKKNFISKGTVSPDILTTI
jgi:hypothetical protein